MIKAKARQKAALKTPSSLLHLADRHSSSIYWQSSNLPKFRISQLSLDIGNEEHFLAFFFHNYVINSDKFHPSIFRAGSEHLLASIRATSTAGLSKYHSNVWLSHSARQRYVQALSLTNDALKDTKSATRDETLLAIIILTSFGDTEWWFRPWPGSVDATYQWCYYVA